MKQLILILLICFSAEAATYYVDPSGNNSNPGSSGSPWLTIAKANTTMVNGDSVIVGAGTYAERTTIAKDGLSFYGGTNVICNGFLAANKTNLVISGFEFTGTTGASAYTGIVHISGSNSCNITISSNYWHDTLGSNVYQLYLKENGHLPSQSCSNVTIIRNRFSTPSALTTMLWGQNHTISSNQFVNIPAWDAGHAFGSGHIYEYNYYEHVDEVGANHVDIIQTYGDSGDSSYNMTFRWNTITNCNAQICNLEQKSGDIRDWTFYGNVYNCMGFAGNFYLPGVKFYNNTLYQVTTNTVAATLGYALSINGSDTKGYSDNFQCYNNIFLLCSGNPSSATQGWYITNVTGSRAITGVSANNNCIYGTGAKTLNPLETGSISVDPGFTNLAGGNFQLSSTSPCIDAGYTLLSTYNTDILGVTRPQRLAWDIGAYELPSTTKYIFLNKKVYKVSQ